MEIKKAPGEIFDEYSEGKEFNSTQGLYETVEKNERFAHGDQWTGVKAPNMVKPVFNIIKRVLTYFVSQIVSDAVGVHITPFDSSEQSTARADIIASQVDAVLERTKFNALSRVCVNNECMDGDTCLFVNFDPEIETNQPMKGDVDLEVVQNTKVIFGNPYSSDVQKQPYILIVQRLYTNTVKDMADANGVSKEEAEKIIPDEDDYAEQGNMNTEKRLTTVITKFWKESKQEPAVDTAGQQYMKTVKSVHMIKCTKDVMIKDDTDLDYRMYPIAYMTWEHVNNSYHGRSPVTGLIPNQIFINKIYAMCMVYMTNMGFPRVFYDENKIAKLTNDVSKATAITNMDMAGKIIDAVKAPDFSNQIIQLIQSTMANTKECMGATDAALGNVEANNTSAIVAVQQASSVPLQLQKDDYYTFVEDVVRCIVDIMACRYGARTVKITESQAKALNLIDHYEYINPITQQPIAPLVHPDGTVEQVGIQTPVYQTYTQIDFGMLKNMNYDINVEIGQSSYWSEQTQMQTLDNLFDKGVITNPITYLEGIPDKYIPNKAKLIDELKQQQVQTQQAQQLQQIQAMQLTGQYPGEQPQGQQGATEGMKDGLDNRASLSIQQNQQLQQTFAKSKQFYGGSGPKA